MTTDAEIVAALMHLLARREPPSTLCPSEVARALSADGWRSLMPQVRAVTAALAVQGRVEVLQRGQVCAPAGPWRGAIRIRRSPNAD
jgi:Protein of unknown function (DUF3253)